MASEPYGDLHARSIVSQNSFSTATLDNSTNEATTALAVLMNWSRELQHEEHQHEELQHER